MLDFLKSIFKKKEPIQQPYWNNRNHYGYPEIHVDAGKVCHWRVIIWAYEGDGVVLADKNGFAKDKEQATRRACIARDKLLNKLKR